MMIEEKIKVRHYFSVDSVVYFHSPGFQESLIGELDVGDTTRCAMFQSLGWLFQY